MGRRCRKCNVRPSANRAGRPGLCVACIDDVFKLCEAEPLTPYVSPDLARVCRCHRCDAIISVTYRSIKEKTYCECACQDCWWRDSVILLRKQDKHRFKLDLTLRDVADLLEQHSLDLTDPALLKLIATDQTSLADTVKQFFVSCRQCLERFPIRAVELELKKNSKVGACEFCSPLTRRDHDVFAFYGLRRITKGQVRLTTPVDASCLECGNPRRISFSDLVKGATPCLTCRSNIDPERPHQVYLVHFAHLSAYKIGFTNTENRKYDRLKVHIREGGELINRRIVPNQRLARMVEDAVLSKISDFRLSLSNKELPQGGGTETWSDDAPPIDLDVIVDDIIAAHHPAYSASSDT